MGDCASRVGRSLMPIPSCAPTLPAGHTACGTHCLGPDIACGTHCLRDTLPWPWLSLGRCSQNDRLFAGNPGEHRALDPRHIAGHPTEGNSIAEQFFVGLDRAT